MRNALRKLLQEQKRRANGEQEPERPADFGFTYPVEYVQKAVLFLDRWGCLPDGGGWADQDDALIDDIMTYLTVRDCIAQEVERGIDTDYGAVETDTPAVRLEDI